MNNYMSVFFHIYDIYIYHKRKITKGRKWFRPTCQETRYDFDPISSDCQTFVGLHCRTVRGTVVRSVHPLRVFHQDRYGGVPPRSGDRSEFDREDTSGVRDPGSQVLQAACQKYHRAQKRVIRPKEGGPKGPLFFLPKGPVPRAL